MVTSAAKYDVAESFFVQEILQLGLPKENADVVASLYRRSKDDLRLHFSESRHLHHRLVSTDWRVDRIMASGGYRSQSSSSGSSSSGGSSSNGDCDRSSDNNSSMPTVSPYLIHVNLNIDTSPYPSSSPEATASSTTIKRIAFQLDNSKLDLMISELSKAQKIMESIGV